jgi:hypothetical protein
MYRLNRLEIQEETLERIHTSFRSKRGLIKAGENVAANCSRSDYTP